MPTHPTPERRFADDVKAIHDTATTWQDAIKQLAEAAERLAEAKDDTLRSLLDTAGLTKDSH